MQTRIFPIQQSYWLQGGYADMCYEILQRNLKLHFVVSTCEGGNAKYRTSGVEGYLQGPVRTRTHLLDLHAPDFIFPILNPAGDRFITSLSKTSDFQRLRPPQSLWYWVKATRWIHLSEYYCHLLKCKLCRSKDNLCACIVLNIYKWIMVCYSVSVKIFYCTVDIGGIT